MGEKIKAKEEFFILPENALDILLSFGRFKDEGDFDLAGLLPCGYLEYITEVVNANRHLSAFAYPDMGDGVLSKWEICRIVQRQLRELSCEDGRYFDIVKIRKFGAGRFRLYVKYGPACAPHSFLVPVSAKCYDWGEKSGLRTQRIEKGFKKA